MRILPWFREEYTSALHPAEVLRRVQANTAPPLSEALLDEQYRTATFQGWVKPAGVFRISRLGRPQRLGIRRNSAMTVVEGEVRAGPGSGSSLRLLHRPALYALFVLGFWLVLASVLVVASGIAWLRGQPKEYASWKPTGFFVGALLLFTAVFWWEVWRMRPLLVQLLQLAPAGPRLSDSAIS